jgi:DNA-binding transcriptional MerR regulator
MEDGPTYGIEELADLGGVSRRTVRYYVQEGLIPAPQGAGRGSHYGPEHLQALLRVKALQERGLALVDVRRALAGKKASELAAEVASAVRAVPRAAWTRVELAPGVELNVSGEVRLPPPGRLLELAEWCRRYFRRDEEKDDA